LGRHEFAGIDEQTKAWRLNPLTGSSRRAFLRSSPGRRIRPHRPAGTSEIRLFVRLFSPAVPKTDRGGLHQGIFAPGRKQLGKPVQVEQAARRDTRRLLSYQLLGFAVVPNAFSYSSTMVSNPP
jgi:hypothetical protein